jgi:hypothetical protein
MQNADIRHRFTLAVETFSANYHSALMGLSHAHCPTIHHYNKNNAANNAAGHAAIVQSATNANILVNFYFFSLLC